MVNVTVVESEMVKVTVVTLEIGRVEVLGLELGLQWSDIVSITFVGLQL